MSAPIVHTAYPFSYGHQGKTGTKHDHKLSGVEELQKLLDGQSLIVKQEVFSWVASQAKAPMIHTLRTKILVTASQFA